MTALPVFAQDLMSSKYPIDIAEALRELGYKAKVEKDSYNDPMITSAMNGVNFVVLFYGCKDNRDCQSIQYSASFTLDTETERPDLNEWNKINRYTKAHVADDNDIVLKMDVNMAGDGISTGAFNSSFRHWKDLLAEFLEHIHWS